MVVGRSHTGKSQMLLNSIVSNLINHPEAHIVIFSMDEPRELVAMKLYCLLRGRSSTDVEESIKNLEPETLDDLAEASEQELSRIAIIDESFPLEQMAEVMDEIREWWGVNPSFCMIDYLELLPGGDSDATGVTTKAQAVKRWAKTQRVPVGLVHQAGRGSGDKGKAAGLYAGRYGGTRSDLRYRSLPSTRQIRFISMGKNIPRQLNKFEPVQKQKNSTTHRSNLLPRP